jgi:hypothetical protein
VVTYTTIRLPNKGQLSGHCITRSVTANTPGEAAERHGVEGETILVVEHGEDGRGIYTYAFRCEVPPAPPLTAVPA